MSGLAPDTVAPDSAAPDTAISAATVGAASSTARLAAAEDADLVIAARCGHQGAFTQLYRRHLGLVRLVVSERTGDRVADPDIVQVAFTRAFERLDRLRSPDGFRPWLLQIARNAALDHRRRLRPSVSLDAEAVPAPAAGDDVQDECERRAVERELVVAIEQLPPREADAVRQIQLAGIVDYDQLAELLGTSPDTARTVIYRARIRLRRLLAARLGEELATTTRRTTEDP